MILANYHTHTYRCGHADGEDRAYIENAIRHGMQVLGFSDHCPFVFPDGYESPIRMSLRQVDGYFTSLTKLRDEYKKDITIYIGFETEYLPELIEEQDKLLADYPVDYHILGQHYLEREPYGEYVSVITDDEKLLEAYVERLIKGLETGRFVYAAHPDLVGFRGDAYQTQYTRLCKWLAEHDVPVEINLHGIVQRRHYTDPRFLQIAANAGCRAIIGCDAHTPSLLDDRSAVSDCETMAAKAGLPLVNFLPHLKPKHT